jgi:hypothetical protein
MSLQSEISALYPWLPQALVDIYVAAFIETGDEQLAWSTLRASTEYDSYFPGNKREDGTLRYSEGQYAAIKEDYRNTIAGVGINPDIFEANYAQLIAGNVEPDELFQRVNAVTERVRYAGEDTRREYAEQWNLELTDEAMIASALDPVLGRQILERKITMAEIAGTAAQRGLDVDFDLAASLFASDMDENAAREIFGQAANLLPTLSVLAQRHADPDDEFDLEEFTNATFNDDPFQRNRMRRLISQERASFQQSGQLGVKRNELGGQAGLARR